MRTTGMRTTRRVAAVAAALVLGLTGACGGDDTAGDAEVGTAGDSEDVTEGSDAGSPDDTNTDGADTSDEGESGESGGY